VGDQIRVARIGPRRIQRAGEPQASIGLAQEHHPAVAGNLAALETRLDFAPFQSLEKQRVRHSILALLIRQRDSALMVIVPRWSDERRWT
jgi:hypothetical protein